MKISPRVVRALVMVAIASQLFAFVLSWTAWLPSTFFMQLWPAGLSADSVRALGSGLRWSGALLGVPGLAALCYGLWQLARLAANAGRGAMFDLANIVCLRRFAGAILLSTALSIIEVPLRALAWHTPLSIGVSGDQLLVVLMGGLFYLVVRLMHEGRRLARENEGFV
jgi:hypothetical protein